MNKVVSIKGVAIGAGMPKVCIPLVGNTFVELINETKYLKRLDFDVVEIRIDFYEEVTNLDSVKKVLAKIREILFDKPIIFTFRSTREGGQREIKLEYYIELYRIISRSRLVDIIDIELFNNEEDIKNLVEVAHENDVSVIISNHDFNSTPTKEEIISRLKLAKKLGADIPKIAVMPTCTQDVLTLMDATRIMREEFSEGPIIAISMSGKGVISRLAGEFFGSALTFGSAKYTSAPGQIPATELRQIIESIHNWMNQ